MNKLSVLLVGFLLFSCGLVNAQQRKFIKHSFGEVIINGEPKRIVVVDNGALELFNKLEIPVLGVPANLPEHLSKYKADKYVKVGTSRKPDLEAIKSAKPDLIVLGGWGGKVYEELNAVAPVIGYGENYNDYMSSFVNNLKNIGYLFNKQKEVDNLLIGYYADIAAVKKLSTNDSKKALIVLHTQNNYSAYGAKSRFGFIHDELGVKQSNDSLSTHLYGTRLTDELLLKANPDYIFLIDRDKAIKGEKPEKDKLITPSMKQTNAYKNGKIILLSGVWYLSGNALSTLETKINEVQNGLYNK